MPVKRTAALLCLLLAWRSRRSVPGIFVYVLCVALPATVARKLLAWLAPSLGNQALAKLDLATAVSVAATRWVLSGSIREVKSVTRVFSWLDAVKARNMGAAMLSSDTAEMKGVWIAESQLDLPSPTLNENIVVLLYIHGGGYFFNSSDFAAHHHYMLCKEFNALELAASGNNQKRRLVVFSLEYDLAPESPFPSQIHCAAATFRKLQNLTTAPILVGGDSAGAHCAISLMAYLKKSSTGPIPLSAAAEKPATAEKAASATFPRSSIQPASRLNSVVARQTSPTQPLPIQAGSQHPTEGKSVSEDNRPAGIILFSPWVNPFISTCPSLHGKPIYDILSVDGMQYCSKIVFPQKTRVRYQPKINICSSQPEDLVLPRTLIIYGGAEVLCDEIEDFVNIMKSQPGNVNDLVEVHCFDGMPHDFKLSSVSKSNGSYSIDSILYWRGFKINKTIKMVPKIIRPFLRQYTTRNNVNAIPAAWLRDACQCSACVHPSTRQKLFSTGGLASGTTCVAEGAGTVSFSAAAGGRLSAVPGAHRAAFAPDFLATHAARFSGAAPPSNQLKTSLWTALDFAKLRRARGDIDYRQLVLPSNSESLLALLGQLQSHGLVFIKNIPVEEGDNSSLEPQLEQIVKKMGCIIRETFYGRTWDVKSVQNAKNIAYTSLDLGLHMDLLYFESPPGIQFLHSLKNSVTGGESIFLDSYHAALKLKETQPRHYKTLTEIPITFHYDNDSHLMKQHRYTISEDNLSSEAPFGLRTFYSPPFQGPLDFVDTAEQMESLIEAMRAYEDIMREPDMIYSTRLEPGTAVVFRNLRILHGRTEFDAGSGERHFKGAYVDYDVMRDRLMFLSRQVQTQNRE
ncbi:taurine catabolism dioxygenase TauD, TfdA family-domain-containing protein [Obelidium mucronatum]|nr:taurine catabolism dioxygenase TauD, TfdA family-domain-containing protein [Obelidium mucronatum]